MDETETIAAKTNLSQDGAVPSSAPSREGTGTAVHEPDWTEARQLALKQLDKLVASEPKVLRGNRPEAVHALRVASRRLQEELDLIYSKPRPSEIRRLRRKIRRCRRILSGLRNCDVLLARTEARLAASQSTRRQAWEAVGAFLHKRREVLFSKAVHKLTRMNLPEVYLELRDHLTGPTTVSQPSRNGRGQAESEELGHPAESVSKRLGEELSRRWEEFERQAGKANEDPENAGLHPSRIAAKKLRYLIEVAAEFEVKGSREALDWFKKLQASLGDWHDLEMSEAVLTAMVGNAKFIRENLSQAPLILKIIELDRKSKEQLRRKGMETLHHAGSTGPVRDWISALG